MNSFYATHKFSLSLFLSLAIAMGFSNDALGYQSMDRQESSDPYFQPPKDRLPNIRQAKEPSTDWVKNEPFSKPTGINLGSIKTGIPADKGSSIIRQPDINKDSKSGSKVVANPLFKQDFQLARDGKTKVTTPWGNSKSIQPQAGQLRVKNQKLDENPSRSQFASTDKKLSPLSPLQMPSTGVTDSNSFPGKQLSQTDLPKVQYARSPENPGESKLAPSSEFNSAEFTPNRFASSNPVKSKSKGDFMPNRFVTSQHSQNVNSNSSEFQSAKGGDFDSNIIKNQFAAKSKPAQLEPIETPAPKSQSAAANKITPQFSSDHSFVKQTGHEQSKVEDSNASQAFGSPSRTLDDKQPSTKTAKAETEKVAFEPGRVLALVGGEPIFVGDVIFDVNQFIQKVAPMAPESVRKIQRPILMQRMLPNFINTKLLYVSTVRGLPEQTDVEQILKQAEGEFDEKALDGFMEQMEVNSPIELDAHLRAMGSSLRKLRRKWSQEQLVRFFLSQQLKVDTEVSHQEMLDYYQENAAEFSLKPRAKWEQVMVRFDKHLTRDDARKAIVEMGNKIVYGAKLPAVAKQSSHGFRASQGGQHDWTSKGALVLKEIDKAIFEQPVGALSDIIESRDGFHIIRVLERNEATKKSFLDAQVDIKEKIATEKRNEAFAKHLAKLKEEIPVEIFELSTEDDSLKNR